MKDLIRPFSQSFIVGSAVLVACCFAQAQDASTAANHIDTGAKQMLSSADKAFAMKAAQGGMAEVQLGKLAADKASGPDVKAFGQMMVDDHTKAGDQLKTVAQGENMTLPTSVDSKDQAEYDKLSKMSGAAFDKEYVRDMVKDHTMDVKDFQRESTHGRDAGIKNFAAQTLPTLQEHLTKIKGIQSKMGSGAASM